MTDARAEIDHMMYQYVQTEIEMAGFRAWFIQSWPGVDRGALASLCGRFERDEMPWQDMAAAFTALTC